MLKSFFISISMALELLSLPEKCFESSAQLTTGACGLHELSRIQEWTNTKASDLQTPCVSLAGWVRVRVTQTVFL